MTAAPTGAQWGDVTPSGMTALQFSGASARINVTQNIFDLTGSLKGYAAGYLVCRKVAPTAGGAPPAGGTPPPASWDYLSGGVLGDQFKFADLIGALSPVGWRQLGDRAVQHWMRRSGQCRWPVVSRVLLQAAEAAT